MTSSTADVRQFLTDYFSDEELTTLCFDYFPEVYDGFASGMSKGQKIQLLVEYGRRREQWTELLKVLQQQRPGQFAKRLGQANNAVPTSSTSSVSGGVNVSGDKVTVGNDVVGRDQITQTTINIAHATIIQPSSSQPEAALASNAMTWGGLQFVRVPASKFLMGSKDDNKLASDDERPQHTVEIPYDYWMARYPVTNEQFAQFIASTRYNFDQGDWRQKANHPVVNISWHDAMAYCKWLNDTLHGELKDLTLRLPTEAEWEKAARGTHGNEWPWGNEFDRNKCNSSEGGKKGITSVGVYSPQGDSPYGAADMAGNVWEWCHSLYKPYPYQADDDRESEVGDNTRVLRGGAFYLGQLSARCAFRHDHHPDDRDDRLGWRVVVSPGSRF